MAALRPLTAADLHALDVVNCDVFTETFAHPFYLKYLSSWPDLCYAAEAPDGAVLGYIIGKVEGVGDMWHGHLTALSIAPEGRVCGVAGILMNRLESICRSIYKCYFMDLYVRVSNQPAVAFYRKRGYKIFKTEKGYYSGAEDALDMRMPFFENDPQGISLRGAELSDGEALAGVHLKFASGSSRPLLVIVSRGLNDIPMCYRSFTKRQDSPAGSAELGALPSLRLFPSAAPGGPSCDITYNNSH
ncbi:N-terminal acetyltransferase B complex catalytic subunit NAA20 [Cyclospora cayetanensis]|uniref:N-terminal acetyltransferase B complex catalytic subunit NAA20 n=1 Tax=Cyclospora cayetanensis TaxID=88456 RepID=A0A6P6S2B8_9EIME|nr:N-terminal acetyltransferase B complex catalytic subunit NAA20 [Cyclospora cayetanensis]